MHWYLLLLIWFSLPNRHTSKEKYPPGTIKLENNLFVDKTEISSLEYREYLYWLKRIFGEEGKILKNAFPNTAVYDSLAKSFNVTSVEFIFQPQFANYPIVGVSFEQATNFCQWRSDRVFEMILVTNKIMEWDTSQNKATFFTIKKYHDQPPPKNKEEKSIRYPEYRLPTIEEWNSISTHKLVDKRFEYKLKPQPEEIINRIINLYGSVSELTTTPGISKGGSYKDDKTQINSDWNRQYSGPSDWLGFRCVCSWKY